MRGGPIPLSELRGTQIVEVTVDEGSVLVGLSLRELELPEHVLVVAVERDPQVLIPRGETIGRAGDRLHILVQDEKIRSLYDRLGARHSSTASQQTIQ